MKKLRFLLLDANVVIELFELRLWPQIIERCEVLLAETVVNEARYCEAGEEQRRIDVSQDIQENRVTVVQVETSAIEAFRGQFDPTYFERIDPGEAESLAYMLLSKDPCFLCSSDAIVFRILGRLNRGEQGLSLEEALDRIGLSRALPSQFRKEARDRWTKQGEQDMIRGTGMERP